MSTEIAKSEKAMREIIARLESLKLGREGALIVFSSEGATDIFSKGIHYREIPAVLKEAMELAELEVAEMPRG